MTYHAISIYDGLTYYKKNLQDEQRSTIIIESEEQAESDKVGDLDISVPVATPKFTHLAELPRPR